MSDLVIGDYTAAVTIDGSTHYMLIQPGSSSTAYRKISRNVLLGVSGQPADISTVQSITNKTLDNTNTITLKDTLFTLQDDVDVTKQARFQLSGITAGQTRTYTLPNATGTLADLATAQTFTNKTITSPAVTGGTISNSTITVDAIGEFTSANGVTIDGLNIKDGALNTNNSVITASITDGAVTPAKLLSGTGSGWTWSAYVPTFTNLTVGNGTLAATWIQIGKTVFVRISLLFGTTTSISGAVNFSLPVTAQTAYVTNTEAQYIGTVKYQDGGGSGYMGTVQITSGDATKGTMVIMSVSSTYPTAVNISATIPITWGQSDLILAQMEYEAA